MKENEISNEEKRQKRMKDWNRVEDSGLKLPKFSNPAELFKWLNTEAIDFRPKAKVVFIKQSQAFSWD